MAWGPHFWPFPSCGWLVLPAACSFGVGSVCPPDHAAAPLAPQGLDTRVSRTPPLLPHTWKHLLFPDPRPLPRVTLSDLDLMWKG